MTPITLIMAYYDNYDMLQAQYSLLRELPAEIRANLSLIVVDDCSPNRPAVPAEDLGLSCPMKLFRMEQDIPWNQDACRNIGVKHAETEWLFLTDMDHLVPVETWLPLIQRRWDPTKLFTFRRVSAPDMSPFKWHPNTWFMSKTLYNKAGGYDERFAGCYGTDGDFQRRVLTHTSGKAYTALSLAIIRVPRQVVADASTTTLQRKNPADKRKIAAFIKERGNKPPERFRFKYQQVFPQ